MAARIDPQSSGHGDSFGNTPAAAAPVSGPPPAKTYLWLALLVAGYMGVYLCRKNYSVAIPLLQKEFGVSKADLGTLASVSTIAYAVGKICFGPVIDRFGGGICLSLSMSLVALFGGLGAAATSIPLLGLAYSGNRLAGSASWGSMLKLLPDWFNPVRLPFATALLSLSYVFGGVCAVLFAGQVAASTHNNWRAVMGIPSLVLLAVIALIFAFLPRSIFRIPKGADGGKAGFSLGQVIELLQLRQFWVVCALSFVLTLLRETFNTWTVDFFKTEGGTEMSTRIAAFLSTPFDAMGALGILFLGWIFGRVDRTTRVRVLVAMLLALTVLIWTLPTLVRINMLLVPISIGLIGFLAYGPYSLLGGIMSVEIRGKEYVASVAGAVDATGYLAGIFAGRYFGLIVDHGGYRLGFHFLAGTSLAAAILCLFLYSKKDSPNPP